jgi:hypothetical protein
VQHINFWQKQQQRRQQQLYALPLELHRPGAVLAAQEWYRKSEGVGGGGGVRGVMQVLASQWVQTAAEPHQSSLAAVAVLQRLTRVHDHAQPARAPAAKHTRV